MPRFAPATEGPLAFGVPLQTEALIQQMLWLDQQNRQAAALTEQEGQIRQAQEERAATGAPISQAYTQALTDRLARESNPAERQRLYEEEIGKFYAKQHIESQFDKPEFLVRGGDVFRKPSTAAGKLTKEISAPTEPRPFNSAAARQSAENVLRRWWTDLRGQNETLAKIVPGSKEFEGIVINFGKEEGPDLVELEKIIPDETTRLRVLDDLNSQYESIVGGGAPWQVEADRLRGRLTATPTRDLTTSVPLSEEDQLVFDLLIQAGLSEVEARRELREKT